jgi:hypothetical protein
MSQRSPLEDLNADKISLVGKYRLLPKTINNKLYWVRQFSNRPDHPYGTHRALVNCSIIELVFSFYDLCVAKMTYFSKNIEDYDSAKMNYRTREMEPCALWDMEFLIQRETGILVDLRNLAAITEIEVFREMCNWLEVQLADQQRQPRLVVGL